MLHIKPHSRWKEKLIFKTIWSKEDGPVMFCCLTNCSRCHGYFSHARVVRSTQKAYYLRGMSNNYMLLIVDQLQWWLITTLKRLNWLSSSVWEQKDTFSTTTWSPDQHRVGTETVLPACASSVFPKLLPAECTFTTVPSLCSWYSNPFSECYFSPHHSPLLHWSSQLQVSCDWLFN